MLGWLRIQNISSRDSFLLSQISNRIRINIWSLLSINTMLTRNDQGLHLRLFVTSWWGRTYRSDTKLQIQNPDVGSGWEAKGRAAASHAFYVYDASERSNFSVACEHTRGRHSYLTHGDIPRIARRMNLIFFNGMEREREGGGGREREVLERASLGEGKRRRARRRRRNLVELDLSLGNRSDAAARFKEGKRLLSLKIASPGARCLSSSRSAKNTSWLLAR